MCIWWTMEKKTRASKKNKAYLHLLEYTIIYLGEIQRRLGMSKEQPALNAELTRIQNNVLAQDSVRLLHALEPSLNYAIKVYPEYKVFLLSCKTSIEKIKKDLGIQEGSCDCKGCKPESNS